MLRAGDEEMKVGEALRKERVDPDQVLQEEEYRNPRHGDIQNERDLWDRVPR